MVSEQRPDLRERTRRAVQQEITEVAQRLFVEFGYEQTTIDEIANTVGISRRSVFRYFPTKEDIVVGKFDFVAEAIVEELRARPSTEAVWESLRRMLDLLVGFVDTPGKHEVAEPMQRMVFASPTLLASYLEKLEKMKYLAELVIRERAREHRAPYADTDPTPGAVVGAAFGCLLAAQRAWLAGNASALFADCLDRAMTSLEPNGHAQ